MGNRRVQRRPVRGNSNRHTPRELRSAGLWLTRAGAPPVLVLAAALAAYANTFSTPFIYDDKKCIVQNSFAQRFTSPREMLSDLRLGISRPLVLLSVQVNHAWGGLDVRGYHVVNLAIHVLAALTLYGIVRRTLLTGRAMSVDDRTASLLALATALVWVLHPLQTESVTYVIQRAESLMGLFYLLVIYLVLRGATTARSNPRVAWYVLAVVACTAGMLTKEVMITAPLVVALFDRVFLSRSWVEVARLRWPLYVGLFASCVPLMALMSGVWSNPQSEVNAIVRAAPLEYAATQPGVVLHYLRLAFWPHPLCFDYTWPLARTAAAVIVPGTVIVLLVAVVAWALWYRPAAGFLGAALFMILSPTSSVMPIQDAAVEHRMYLPLAPLVALVVVGAYWFMARVMTHFRITRRVAAAVYCGTLGAMVVLLAGATYRRNADYRSDHSIWADTVAKRPNNPRARLNLGNALFSLNRSDEAVDQLLFAIQLKPDAGEAYCELGDVYFSQGRSEAAMQQYAEAIRQRPNLAIAHYNLGGLLAEGGKFSEAEKKFRDALAVDPKLVNAHNELGILFGWQGRFEQAAEAFAAALAVQADYAPARKNLAQVRLRQGRDDDAARCFQRLLALRPGDQGALAGLARILERQSKYAEAAELAQRALLAHPDSAELSYRLAAALAAQGRLREAVLMYRQALSVRPRWPEAASELAWILATSVERELRAGAEAIGLAKAACVQMQTPSAAALDALAAAHAEVGEFQDAVNAAELALASARKNAGAEAVAGASRRLDLYRDGQPCRSHPSDDSSANRFGGALDNQPIKER